MVPATPVYVVASQYVREAQWVCQITADPQAPAPKVQAMLQGTMVEGVTLAPNGLDQWQATVPIPKRAICDGASTLVLVEAETQKTLADLTLVAGTPADRNLQATVTLLRAEVDMLKRAFRDHCRKEGEG